MTCSRCGQPTPANELSNYNGRCEDCYAGSPYQPPADPRYERTKGNLSMPKARFPHRRRKKEDK